MTRPTVAILGGGASGTLLAVALLRHLHPRGLRVVMVERCPEVGRGVAYSTPWTCHRLNVPAGKMSAFPRDGDHFLRWARRADGTERGDFAARNRYGDYLRAVLADAAAKVRPGVELVRVRDEAVRWDGGCVHLRDGAPIAADRVVLATGNLPPAPLPSASADLVRSGRYHPDPWCQAAPGTIARGGSVLLVGTGLTMVDLALSLAVQGGPDTIYAVSRTGLLPRAHAPAPTAAPLPYVLPNGPFTLDELVADVERRMGEAESQGRNWRDVIDSLRPVTNRIWHRLPVADRDRFVREVSRHWEVRRHRMAPTVAAAVSRMQDDGRLDVRGSGLRALRPVDGGVEARLADGDVLHADRVVNCTGPSVAVALAEDPLLSSLAGAGHVRPGPLGLGLDHDSCGALVGADGTSSRVLWGLGPVRKGRLWETTAIPEIRAQAFELADRLAAQLSASQPVRDATGGDVQDVGEALALQQRRGEPAALAG